MGRDKILVRGDLSKFWLVVGDPPQSPLLGETLTEMSEEHVYIGVADDDWNAIALLIQLHHVLQKSETQK